MAQAIASMACILGSPQAVLEGSLQLICPNRLANPRMSSRISVGRTVVTVVRAQQGECEAAAQTSRRAALGLVAAGLAGGSFVQAGLPDAKPIKMGAPPPPSGGLINLMESAAATRPPIKVAAIGGSLSKFSKNSGLIRAAIQLSKEYIPEMQIEQVDISNLPFLNTDLLPKGLPSSVKIFRQKILDADSILFASPEYNYSVTGPLKNAIDWGSIDPNVWADKPAAIVSVGADFGGGRSQYHLRQAGVRVDIHFINKPELFVKAYEPPPKFDDEGNLIDEATRESLKQVLVSLQAFTYRLQGK